EHSELWILATGLQLLSLLGALQFHYVQYVRSPGSSDALLGYWLVSAGLSIEMTHLEARHMSIESSFDGVLLQSAYIGAVVVAFVLEITTRPSPSYFVLDCECQDNMECRESRSQIGPKQHSNIFSRLVYMWVTPAINNGLSQNRYREEDLLSVPASISGNQANANFLAEWESQCVNGNLSLLRVLARSVSHDVVVSGLYMALSTTAQLLQPLVLKQVIGYFQASGDSTPIDEGLMLALGMGCLGLVLYHKTLHLSSESRSRHSTGEIASYLGVDVGTLATSINYVHFVWDYPLRISVVLYMLFQTVGYASLAGVALLLLNTFVSARIARVVQRHIKKYVDSRDQRMQVVSETVANIKGIKLYAWQDAFIGRIEQIRNKMELLALRKVGLWKSLLTLTSSLVTVFICLTTFAVYVLFDGTSHGPLTSQLVFVSLSLFMLLEEPLSQSPTVVSAFVSAARSYFRICDLAASCEVDSSAVSREPYDRDASSTSTNDVLVSVENGTFKWLSADEPTLHNVSVQCKRDELVAVIGRVGAGKSSLVSAILGDMIKCDGSVRVRGSIAYVPQQAWIMNATLRDNILFGSQFDQEFYNRVVDACALRPDLDMLPGGDMTEIGEKGINLSGGQKARVSLARAVYARADIYILDDPLAAVDAHVGKHIFTHVLGPQGMLKTRARILRAGRNDLAQVDDNMPTCAELGIKGFIQMLVALLLIVISAPFTLVFLIPLSLVYADLHRQFMPTTRDTRRMVNTMRNMCISATEETISGATSIRAYTYQPKFEYQHAGCVESYTMAWWTYLCANRWLAVRLDVISAGIVLFTNITLILVQHVFGGVDGGYVGLSLTYALSLVGVLNMCIRYTTMLEMAFISIERTRKYSLLVPEASKTIEGCRPATMWPEQGMVEFKDYSTRYRDGLDLVLKGLSFRVLPNQKVGIVGRTGAGKSSLTLALFRIIEAASGQILIDGEDIAKYGLFDVRSKLSIIPQDPVLFAGTVRENLDPFNNYSDQEIWQALEHAHLADVIRAKDERLEFMVTQSGENFSVGQRQLICLARALLKRAKVLVLDEATAAIDNATDTIIQESIRKEFKNCTVLTIAHRLNTIIDSDMILVVDGGRLAEYDTPQNLLENKNSLFAKLIEEARATNS
ncbi:hypothetical protein IWW56_005135, partial [Coemansia sp. RSA 2131]